MKIPSSLKTPCQVKIPRLSRIMLLTPLRICDANIPTSCFLANCGLISEGFGTCLALDPVLYSVGQIWKPSNRTGSQALLSARATHLACLESCGILHIIPLILTSFSEDAARQLYRASRPPLLPPVMSHTLRTTSTNGADVPFCWRSVFP